MNLRFYGTLERLRSEAGTCIMTRFAIPFRLTPTDAAFFETWRREYERRWPDIGSRRHPMLRGAIENYRRHLAEMNRLPRLDYEIRRRHNALVAISEALGAL